MDFDTLTHLLERYENGTTTVQEDTALQQYFLSDNVAPQFAYYTPLFRFYKHEKQVSYNQALPVLPKRHTRKYRWKLLSIAAITILMLGIYLPTTSTSQQLSDYSKAEQELYNKTKQALIQLHTNFAKGTQSMQTLHIIDTHFENAQHSTQHIQQFGNITQQLLK